MKKKYLSSILVGMMTFFSISANAHAHVKETTPAKNSIVKELPKQISIKFSEDLEAAVTKIEVKNLTTGEVVSEKTELGANKSALVTHLKNQKAKKTIFEVTWKAVSKDGHTMKGAYVFTVDPSLK